jgi:purine-cytosine permease-like protein
MESPTPPTPRSMSDDELNAEVARLQSQPDGLMAAMALIEAQNVLRQQDSFAYSQWQLQAQMQAASTPAAAFEPEPSIPSPIAPNPVVPEPEVVEPVSIQTSSPEPIAHEPIPTTPSAEVFSPVVNEPPAAAPAAVSNQSVDDIVAALNRNYENSVTDHSEPEELANTAEKVEVTEVASAEPTVVEPEPVAIVATNTGEISSQNIQGPVEVDAETLQVSRTRTSAALSWSWLSLSSTPLVFVLAAFLKESGASLSQSLVVIAGLIVTTAVLAGVGAVAAKRGTSPIGVVSRAAFGVWGNVFPAGAMFLVKILWSIALLVFGARILSPLISSQPWFAIISSQFVFPAEYTAFLITAVPLVIIASLVAGYGGLAMLRAQQVAASFSMVGLVAIGYFAFSSNSILDLQQGDLLSAPALLDLALLSFALFGFTVFSQSGDFARKLPTETPGAKVFFLSFVSTLFVPLAASVMGVLWVFMAEDTFGPLLTSQLIPTVAAVAPILVFVAFVVAVGLSVLQLLANSVYSLSGSLASLGAKLPGAVSVLLFAIVVLAGALVSSMLLATSTLLALLIELLVLASVVAASYTGIVLADALIRSRDYHEVSLTRDYGFYGRFNTTNSIGFVLATALGFGYLNGAGTLSSWAGYLGDLTPAIFDIAGSNIGIAMAFGLAILFPVLFGIPRIKSQEVKLMELDERREELKQYLDTAN